MFTPSKELTNMIYNSLEAPDDEFIRNIKVLNEYIPDDLIEESDFETIVSEHIDGYLANLSRRSKIIYKSDNNMIRKFEPINIATSKNFNKDIYEEFISILELTTNIEIIIKLLFKEFYKYVSISPKMNWGIMYIKNNKIYIQSIEKGIDISDINNITEEYYKTTK